MLGNVSRRSLQLPTIRSINMGHRLEAYCLPEHAEIVIAISQAFGIDAQIIGRTELSERSDQANHVTIRRPGVELSYG